MRTLFTKILLWFLLTVVVTFWGTFYVSSIFMQNQPDYNRFRFELNEARYAWESQGQPGLAQFFGRTPFSPTLPVAMSSPAAIGLVKSIHRVMGGDGDLFRYLSFASIRVVPLWSQRSRGTRNITC